MTDEQIIETYLKKNDLRMVTANGNYSIFKARSKKRNGLLFTSKADFLKHIAGDKK